MEQGDPGPNPRNRTGAQENKGKPQSSSGREEDEGDPEKRRSYKAVVSGFTPDEGMSLMYWLPSEVGGRRTARCSEEMAQEGMTEWHKALVGYFLGRRPPFQMVENSVRKMWRLKHELQVRTVGNGIFLFIFGSNEEKAKILEGGPWHIARNPLVLRQWDRETDLSKPDLEKVPLWVTLPNLPLYLWTQDALSRIASVLGRPLFTDRFTRLRTRLAYARLCVEVTEDVVSMTEIPVMVGEKLLMQKISFDWVPPHCPKCAIFGHGERNCPKTQREGTPIWRPKENTQFPNQAGEGTFTQKGTNNVEGGNKHVEEGFQEVKRKGKRDIRDEDPTSSKNHKNEHMQGSEPRKNLEVPRTFINQNAFKILEEKQKEILEREGENWYEKHMEVLQGKGERAKFVSVSEVSNTEETSHTDSTSYGQPPGFEKKVEEMTSQMEQISSSGDDPSKVLATNDETMDGEEEEMDEFNEEDEINLEDSHIEQENEMEEVQRARKELIKSGNQEVYLTTPAKDTKRNKKEVVGSKSRSGPKKKARKGKRTPPSKGSK